MWKRHTDAATGRVYTYPRGSTDAADLWLVCESDGREYYHNVKKNVTTWVLPELSSVAGSEVMSEVPDLPSGSATPSPPQGSAVAADSPGDSDSDDADRAKTLSLKERLAAARKQREDADAKRRQRAKGSSTSTPRRAPTPEKEDVGPALSASQLTVNTAKVHTPPSPVHRTPTPRTPVAVSTLTQVLTERLTALQEAVCGDCKKPKNSARFCTETGRAHGRPEPEVVTPQEDRRGLNTATDENLHALLEGTATATTTGDISPMEALSASAPLQGSAPPPTLQEPVASNPVVQPRVPTIQFANQSPTGSDVSSEVEVSPRGNTPPMKRKPAPASAAFSHKTITLYDEVRGETELRVIKGVTEADMLRVIRAKLGVPVEKPLKIMTTNGTVSFDAVEDGAVYMYTVEEELDMELVCRVLLECYGGVTGAYSSMAVRGLVEPALVRQEFARLSLGKYAEPFIAALTQEKRSLTGFASMLGIQMPEPGRRTQTTAATPRRDHPSTSPARGGSATPRREATAPLSQRKPRERTTLAFDVDASETHTTETPDSMKRSVQETLERREQCKTRPKGATGLSQRVVYANGSVYEGALVQGLRHGQGRLTHGPRNKPISIYDGEWLDGRQNGEGNMAWAGKGYYQGEWKEGQMEGRGKLQVANLNIPKATFVAGKLHGRAVVQYPNGDTFRGELHHNHRSSCTVEHANGDIYKWKFRDPTHPGTGIALLQCTTGDTYEGEVTSYKKHGNGVFTFSGGHMYEGTFFEGNMSGHGSLTYSEGSAYTGNFKNNLFCGEGTYTDTEGQKYTGEWSGGKMHGNGIMTFANGDKWKGVWVEDVRKEGDYVQFTTLPTQELQGTEQQNPPASRHPERLAY